MRSARTIPRAKKMTIPAAGRIRIRAPWARSGSAAPRKSTDGSMRAAAASAAGSCDRPGFERYGVSCR